MQGQNAFNWSKNSWKFWFIVLKFVFGSFKQDELFQEAKFIATILIGLFLAVYMHSAGLVWHWTTDRLTQFLFNREIRLLKYLLENDSGWKYQI